MYMYKMLSSINVNQHCKGSWEDPGFLSAVTVHRDGKDFVTGVTSTKQNKSLGGFWPKIPFFLVMNRQSLFSLQDQTTTKSQNDQVQLLSIPMFKAILWNSLTVSRRFLVRCRYQARITEPSILFPSPAAYRYSPWLCSILAVLLIIVQTLQTCSTQRFCTYCSLQLECSSFDKLLTLSFPSFKSNQMSFSQ